MLRAVPGHLVALLLGSFLGAAGVQAATVELVRDVAPGAASSDPRSITGFFDEVWFSADDASGTYGREPWRSDGTAGGTAMVADMRPGAAGSSLRTHAVVSGRLLFWAITGPTLDLFSVPGPGASPTLLMPAAGDGVLPVVLGDRLIFTGEEPATGIELWVTDGTPAGTLRLGDAAEGARDGAPLVLTPAGDHLYFSAVTSVGGAFLGRELWRTDGTPAGTTFVHDVRLGSGDSTPANLRPFDDRLHFQANDPASACGAWRTDGTSAGTLALTPRCIAPLGHIGDEVILFGEADDDSYGMFVWKSDGTPAGTVPVAPLGEHVLVPGFPVSAGGSRAVVGDRIVTTARDAAHGLEPWVTDGTAPGTSVLADLEPGVGHSSPGILATTGAIAFFVATTTANGTQLWRTDGTFAGTFRLTDRVAPTPASADAGIARLVSPSSRGWLLVGDTLFFVMDDVATGAELWKTDGTVAGTVRLTDIDPGPGDSFESALVAAMSGGRLFVAAAAPAVGRELWVIDGVVPPLTDARLRIAKLDTPPGDDVMTLDGRVRVRPEPAIDPLVDGVRLRIDQAGPVGTHDVIVPGGAFDRVTKRGWKAASNGRSWRYRGDGSNGGVRKVAVTGDPATGVFRVKVSAKGGDWSVDAAAPIAVTVMLDAPHGDRGQAGEAVFAPSACAFSGRKLACR